MYFTNPQKIIEIEVGRKRGKEREREQIEASI